MCCAHVPFKHFSKILYPKFIPINIFISISVDLFHPFQSVIILHSSSMCNVHIMHSETKAMRLSGQKDCQTYICIHKICILYLNINCIAYTMCDNVMDAIAQKHFSSIVFSRFPFMLHTSASASACILHRTTMKYNIERTNCYLYRKIHIVSSY